MIDGLKGKPARLGDTPGPSLGKSSLREVMIGGMAELK